jgi:hypothetical protein
MRKQFKKLAIKTWVIDTISQKLQCEIDQSPIRAPFDIDELALHRSAIAIGAIYLNLYEKLPSFSL